MLTRTVCGAGMALVLVSLVCAQAGPAGHWEGTMIAENREIGLTLDLARNAGSEWIASMAIPSQNAYGLYVKDVAVAGKSVKFLAVELMMSTFDLTLGPDGKLAGKVTTRGGLLPVEFRRTGEAKVDLPPASPAVSKELEGDWEGTMPTPGGEMSMAVHFKNQADKTVVATIDIQGSTGLPINDVKQAGQKVEFGLKIAHASFLGTMNKEGTEIVGQLSHDENGAPVTLRKK